MGRQARSPLDARSHQHRGGDDPGAVCQSQRRPQSSLPVREHSLDFCAGMLALDDPSGVAMHPHVLTQQVRQIGSEDVDIASPSWYTHVKLELHFADPVVAPSRILTLAQVRLVDNRLSYNPRPPSW